MSNVGPIKKKKRAATKTTLNAMGEALILRGKTIRVDENGFFSLNDIHNAAGFKKNKRPFDWSRLPTTNPLIIATYERVTGISRKQKLRISDVYKASSSGTWAHPILAASYAGYLKPELEVEMKEVWLRYKSSDATLADEVLKGATDEANEWAATRAFGRVKRFEFTKTLDDHGVTGYGYGNCTNAIYHPIFDATAKKLREKKGLPANGNIRDAMSNDELVYVMMAETLAKGRIQEESPAGNSACVAATKKSASFVRQAIDMEKDDRQKPLEF